MNEAESRSNILGLIVLFAVFTFLGIVLSYFYLLAQVNIHRFWGHIIAVFAMGAVLALIVWLVKRLMKITNNVMSLIVIIISLVIVIYVMWGMWFALMIEMLYFRVDVRVFASMGSLVERARGIIFNPSEFFEHLGYFNRRGTWSFDGNQFNGLPLGLLWASEVLVIIVFPITTAYAAAGLYLTELNAWVQERLMNYGFSAFDDYELDRIASGDIDTILEKPLESQGGPMNAVAVCYHKNEPTEFVAIYKAYWDKNGVLSKGRHIMTIKLDPEKIDALDAGLQAAHFPNPAEKIAPIQAVEEPTDNDSMPATHKNEVPSMPTPSQDSKTEIDIVE